MNLANLAIATYRFNNATRVVITHLPTGTYVKGVTRKSEYQLKHRLLRHLEEELNEARGCR